MTTACILIIGNEILSGRTEDQNISFIAKKLKSKGIELNEVRIVRDDEMAIIQATNELSQKYNYVFTTGGIGPTHDDITSETMAKCLGLDHVLHPEALAILEEYYKDQLNENRLKMAYMPKGSELIYNTVSKAPGFIIKNIYCMAGMPKVMQAMFQNIFPKLVGGVTIYTVEIKTDLVEGVMAEYLRQIQAEFQDVEIGSYPFYNRPPDIGVVLVLSGVNSDRVKEAVSRVEEMILYFKANILEMKR